ncbi:4-(cytidine 5'-diphospho)-2-C-methyl-D-erythritol kinase [Sphingomonas sp. GlSt437]|uniref:4-(cytidine 5'-diphospho)-2-C-methyl-D-erythritol kinase n=1 Tax=Sphingomonas sp. GlSt437 TaxID=3389970 RepID=UPI003A837F73
MTATPITEHAPAKINLALHVRHRRPDGYHELETLFAFLRDGDTIHVEPAPAPSFALTGPFAAVLAGEGDNLVTRAAAAFRAAFAIEAHHAITLDKRLPVASGIGGGSADAAATLRALARLHGVALDEPRLFAIAEGLGADVPACLLGRSAIGTGKGEALTPVAGVEDVPVLLVNPGVAVSTGAVFKAWDGVDRGPIPPGDLLARALAGRNDLEPPARAIAPVIGEVVAMLSAGPGVKLARMSGSGATCFALYETAADRAAAAADLRARHPDWWQLESTLGG